MPSLIPYRDAVLMDFELVVLNRITVSLWHAEIDLLFDFGPPPPAVLRFERVRRGRYWLLLNQQGERLGLSRFTPVARIHPLPGRG